jgi:hypothetical protein
MGITWTLINTEQSNKKLKYLVFLKNTLKNKLLKFEEKKVSFGLPKFALWLTHDREDHTAALHYTACG